MANNYFSPSGTPATGASGSSSAMRSEFALVEAGFDKLPSLASVGNRVVHINPGSTALTTSPGFTMNSSNVLALPGLMDISASGAGQIKFPATQNASANANTLDDYEEGTWTPSVGGNATYNNQAGNYIKIGRVVQIEFQLGVNALGTGSANTVSGLPFTAANDSTEGNLQVHFFTSLASNVTWAAFGVNANATTASAYYLTAAAAASSTTTIFGNSARVFAAGTYRSAS